MDAKKLYGVRDNASKSQLLVHAKTPSCQKHMGPKRCLILDGAPVRINREAKYLGTYISTNGGAAKAVEYRIQQAEQAYDRLHHIWRSTELTIRTKMKIFRSVVINTLSYCLESHYLNLTQKTSRINTNRLTSKNAASSVYDLQTGQSPGSLSEERWGGVSRVCACSWPSCSVSLALVFFRVLPRPGCALRLRPEVHTRELQHPG